MATTEVMSYKPALDQELQTNKGDATFDYIYDMFYNLPTGEAVKKDLLIVFDGATSEGGEDVFKAWLCQATLTLDHFDSVAEKIYFSFSISKIKKGTATVEAGVPTFSE